MGKYAEELVDKYYTLFGDLPCILMCISEDNPEYMKMLEYCIEHKVKTTEEVISKFIRYEKGILY